MTAHDAAADWDWMEPPDVVGLRIVPGGRVVWEIAEYPTGNERLVRLHRLVPGLDHIRVFIRYVHPDTPVEIVHKTVAPAITPADVSVG